MKQKVSKNNHSPMNLNRKQVFGFRKYAGIGLASAVLGSLIAIDPVGVQAVEENLATEISSVVETPVIEAVPVPEVVETSVVEPVTVPEPVLETVIAEPQVVEEAAVEETVVEEAPVEEADVVVEV